MFILLLVLFILIVCYYIFMKDYVEVIKVYSSLEKTLDVRDLLVMKLIPEINDKGLQAKIIELIESRMKNKKIPYNDKIRMDVELNKELKKFYNIINKKADNPVVKATFKNVIEIEKKLIKIRDKYNYSVEKYNLNLMVHKFVCMRFIRMKPLDTYAKV